MKRVIVAAAILIVVLGATRAFAQATGQINGIVTDASGSTATINLNGGTLAVAGDVRAWRCAHLPVRAAARDHPSHGLSQPRPERRRRVRHRQPVVGQGASTGCERTDREKQELHDRCEAVRCARLKRPTTLNVLDGIDKVQLSID